MSKTILITGSTDGIGLETAKRLVQQGHRVLLHGRNPQKLAKVKTELQAQSGEGAIQSYVADLSSIAAVRVLAETIKAQHPRLDVLINNAGIFKTQETITQDGLDVRFAVNTIAPYVLTRQLLPLLGATGRVVNLSSAAQAPVDLQALAGQGSVMAHMDAYAQSKLAITMWTRHLAETLGDKAPVIVAVNPGSLLGSKMVREGFGVAGGDLGIGADILIRAALSEEFADATGKYYDNDAKRFAMPHPDGMDLNKCASIVAGIEAVLAG